MTGENEFRLFMPGDRVVFYYPGHPRHGDAADVVKTRDGGREVFIAFDKGDTQFGLYWTDQKHLRWEERR